MAQFGQFFLAHWELSLAFIIILLLVFIDEWRNKKTHPKSITPQDAVRMMNEESLNIFDLRDKENYQKGHLLGAHQMDIKHFDATSFEPKNTHPILLVCAKGLQSKSIGALLKKQGKSVMILEGGMIAWQDAGLPVVKGK